MNVFRVFNPKAPKPDPAEKRRHQLRQAQRTYRDKSVKYTKMLEQELTLVRAHQARLMMECKQMRNTIQSLEGLLGDCGKTVPSTLSDGKHTIPRGLAHRTMSSTDVTRNLRVPKLAKKPYADSGVSPTNFNTPTGSDISGDTLTPPPTDSEAVVRVGDLDAATVGMEFVLSLEEPCLGHLHGDPNKPDDPTGHCLTTSAQLECVSNQNRFQDPQPSKLLFEQVPATILEHLLSLSSSMCSEHELTPTQAWHQIRQQSHFGGLALQDLRLLAERLRQTIKCHGYGGVIQIQAFKTLMYETLIFDRAF